MGLLYQFFDLTDLAIVIDAWPLPAFIYMYVETKAKGKNSIPYFQKQKWLTSSFEVYNKQVSRFSSKPCDKRSVRSDKSRNK